MSAKKSAANFSGYLEEAAVQQLGSLVEGHAAFLKYKVDGKVANPSALFSYTSAITRATNQTQGPSKFKKFTENQPMGRETAWL